jgi:hypothetical protein
MGVVNPSAVGEVGPTGLRDAPLNGKREAVLGSLT